MSDCENEVFREALRRRVLRDLVRDPGILILAYPYARTWLSISHTTVKESWAHLHREESATLYVHVPFCRRKCAFCDFLAYYGRSEAEITHYIDLLRAEVRLVAGMTGPLLIAAIQFGGGTPSLLSAGQMSTILKTLTSSFRVQPDAEISLEVFPDSEVTEQHLAGWRDAGINRLSFGIQCFDDKLKRNLDRTDTASENVRLINRALNLGFENFNIDLMCGVPGQSAESWLQTMDLTMGLSPAHVCVFPVSVRHPGVTLFEQQSSLPPPELTRHLYDTAASRLKEAGYQRTTRHDFARPGYEYRYERMIAELAPLVGIGANSISYSKDCIYRSHSHLAHLRRRLGARRIAHKGGTRVRGRGASAQLRCSQR